VAIHLFGDVTLGPAPSAPRNVVAVKTDGSTVDLTVVTARRCIRCGWTAASCSTYWTPRTTPPPAGACQSPPERPPIRAPTASSPRHGVVTGTGRPIRRRPCLHACNPLPVEAQPLPPPSPTPSVPVVIETAQQTPPGRDVMPESEGPVRPVGAAGQTAEGDRRVGFLVPFDSATGAASFRCGTAPMSCSMNAGPWTRARCNATRCFKLRRYNFCRTAR